MITKRALFAVAAATSLVALPIDTPMAFYWLRVCFKTDKYEPTEFVFRELKHAGTGIAGRRLLAYGSVDGNEETFSSWRDFGSLAFFQGGPLGEKWNVYYDSSAPRFSFYGRTLRVISRNDFEEKGIWLAWHLLGICLLSMTVFGVSLIQLRRAIQSR